MADKIAKMLKEVYESGHLTTPEIAKRIGQSKLPSVHIYAKLLMVKGLLKKNTKLIKIPRWNGKIKVIEWSIPPKSQERAKKYIRFHLNLNPNRKKGVADEPTEPTDANTEPAKEDEGNSSEFRYA